MIGTSRPIGNIVDAPSGRSSLSLDGMPRREGPYKELTTRYLASSLLVDRRPPAQFYVRFNSARIQSCLQIVHKFFTALGAPARVFLAEPHARGTMKHRSIFFLATAALMALGFAAWSEDGDSAAQWPLMGQNLNNSRSQPNETTIGVSNVASLKAKWVFTTGADVSATPTVAGDDIYFPDWSGVLYAVRKQDGRLDWAHRISEYDNVPGAISRVSPAVHGGDLIIGDVESSTAAHSGANVMAIGRETGSLRWITRVDNHPAAVITG